MRTILIAGVLVLLSGCAATQTTPLAAATSEAAEYREQTINARAMEYQKRGYSARDARARAESEFEDSLAPQRKAEPSARSTPR